MNKTYKILFAVLLILPGFAQSQDNTPPAEGIPVAYFILDASSSMWGRLEGHPKIELAKEVLTKLINNLPKKVNTGFTVFGHRRQNDCNDIEDISPLGIMEKSETINKLKLITPKGKSPLTAAIRHVMDQIKGIGGPKTIILVSDGVESCGEDPCALVSDLKKENIDFKIQVIGLNVSDEESKQLICIAENSGGAYQYIKTTAQIESPTPTPIMQMQVVIKPTATPEGITLINKVPTLAMPAAERGKGEISFEHENWLLPPFYWRLIDPNTGEEAIKSKEFELKDVPAGAYVLAWRQYEFGSTEVIVDNNVIIQTDRKTIVPLSTAIRLHVPSWVKAPRFWGLQDPDSSDQIASFTPFETFLVPPGEYDLVWRQYENRADTISFGRIEIEGGKLNNFDFTTSVSPQFAEWVNSEPYYWGLRKNDSPEYVARFYGRLEHQLVPEGRYTVVYRLTANDSSDSLLGDVDIRKDENTDFIIDSGVVFEIKDTANLPQSIEFKELDAKNNEVASVRLSKNLGPLPLKPAKYKINYLWGAKQANNVHGDTDTITLKQGELLKINLDDIFHDTSVEIKATPTAVPTATHVDEIPADPDQELSTIESEKTTR